MSFDRDVFGWQIQPLPPGYNLVSTGPVGDTGMPTRPGYINGGMRDRQDPVTTPVITVDVDDIGAALGQVEANGGTTMGKKEAVGDVGFTAYFTDTGGNMMGLSRNAG